MVVNKYFLFKKNDKRQRKLFEFHAMINLRKSLIWLFNYSNI